MTIALLFSGGKDSSLAAYILDKMGFDVRLVTATFGINDNWRHAAESAEALGFSHETIAVDDNVLEEACEIVKRDGYPRQGITHIHKKVLESAAERYTLLSDGTRRDDKAPFLDLQAYRALEAGCGVEYLPVLWGFGHKTLSRLCNELFIIEEGESSKINKGDYEGELRIYLKNKGFNVSEIFPAHTQSRVISWRTKNVKDNERKKD